MRIVLMSSKKSEDDVSLLSSNIIYSSSPDIVSKDIFDSFLDLSCYINSIYIDSSTIDV